jgi:GNAT superfamily N-acetyltransferase
VIAPLFTLLWEAITTLPEAQADALQIHPSRSHYQRQGFGHTLLSAVERRAKDLGYRELVVHATLRQESARHLFINGGFVELEASDTSPYYKSV